MNLFFRLLLFLFLFCPPVYAAEAPREELKVKPAPEFKVDLVKAFEPIIKKNYWTIQGFLAVYLVLEFYLFPFLDQLEQTAKEERRKENYFKRREELKRWREEEREREREERQLERDAEDLTSLENWDYFKDDE
ncbi:MAG: hypothetical protein IJQ39_12475 [Thermoguttaceae bacterium]|nr:hypothetical protein [Thermoguttaceae bacterium]